MPSYIALLIFIISFVFAWGDGNSLEEDGWLPNLNMTDDTKAAADTQLHLVFSTTCSSSQNWQSLLLLHSAKAVHQMGKITRIASGCSEEQQHDLIILYHALYPEHFLHFTPDFALWYLDASKSNVSCKLHMYLF